MFSKTLNAILMLACCLFAVSTAIPVSASADNSGETESEDAIQIKPIRHATFVMTYHDVVFYVDPVGSSALFDKFPPPDLILITHDHGDHLNQDTINGVMVDKTTIVAPASVHEKLNGQNQSKTVVMKNGETKEIKGIQIKAIPMYNTTEERLRYHKKGKGNGYILTLEEKRVYIAGDTEDIPEMRRLKNIDIAFIPMNLPYTMDIEQAASAVLDFKPKVAIPYHYRGSNVQKFKKLVEKDSNIKVQLMEWYP